MEPWKEELYHHGIRGMKWGKRNGPPYPLKPEKHSASERKANWELSLKKSSTRQANEAPSVRGGGGGGSEDDEEKKILRDLIAEIDDWTVGKLGEDPMRLLASQAFELTLAEFAGVDPDKLTKAQIESIRRAAIDHYSKSTSDTVKANLDYAKTKSELQKEKNNKEKTIQNYTGHTSTYKNRPRSRQHTITDNGKGITKRGKVEHSELYHHGILGMKWGQRNGPPYPLSPGQHSKAEENAGWRKSLGGRKNPELYKKAKQEAKIARKNRNKKAQEEYDRVEAKIERKYKRGQQLSDKDYRKELEAADKLNKAFEDSKKQYKTDLKTAKQRYGSETLGRTLASEMSPAAKAACYALVSSVGGLSIVSAMLDTGGYENRDLVAGFLAGFGITAAFTGLAVAIDKADYNLDKKSNIKKNDKFNDIAKIKVKHSETQDQKAINPRFDSDMSARMNCTMCTTAYEMRRRGYDVEANYTTKGRNIRDAAAWFNIGEDKIYDFKDYNEFKKAIENMPDGSRGNLCAQMGPFLSNHSVVWEKKGGKVLIRDCQSNKTYDRMDTIVNTNGRFFEFFRTDDATINETLIMDAIRKAGG